MIMYIGMDIGGTNVRIASTESLEDPRINKKIKLDNLPDFEANMRQITKAIQDMGYPVEGIGVGLPGKLNPEKTAIVFARYAMQLVNQPLAETLSDTFECPVVLDGDSPVGGLGEALNGKHKGQNFYYIAYGTGIGSAYVHFDTGKPIAHKVKDEEHALYLNPWQKECGGRGIENTLGKPAAELTDNEWQTVMSKFQDYLFRYISYFRPATIVFGGGVAVKQWPRIQAAIDMLIDHHPEIKTDISLTPLGEDAPLYGAFNLLR
jgi:predicted NBD/HSP70 family sugar kinase